MKTSGEINSWEEETPFKRDESEVEASSKTQPCNDGEESQDAPRSFFSKIKLIQFVNDPCWRRNRIILVVASLIGLVAMYVIATCIVITLSSPRSSPRCQRRPVRKWFDKETVYEILPESLQDTSSKAANGAAKKGDGVGDIKGKINTIFDYRICLKYYLFIVFSYLLIKHIGIIFQFL